MSELQDHIRKCDECTRAGGWVSGYCLFGQQLVKEELRDLGLVSAHPDDGAGEGA